jgi:hypothetical protein
MAFLNLLGIKRSGLRPAWVYVGLVALLAAPAPLPTGTAGAIGLANSAPIKATPLPTVQVRTPFTVKSALAITGKLELGDYAWNPEGAPSGPLEIVADLTWQRLYVYRGGVEIGRSSIIYGANDKPTPNGIFPIIEKDADHKSNLYDADMPYMLRLTMDGITIHGTDHVAFGYASNGCVGIPNEFAKLLFKEAKLGEKVLITNYWKRELYHHT